MALQPLTQSHAEVQADLNKIEATPEFTSVGSGLGLSNKVLAADTTVLSVITETGNKVEMTMDSATYVLSLSLKDKNGNILGSTQTVNLPLGSTVVNGQYDSANKKIILTQQNGGTIDVSIASLISGLQTEITASSKLSADLVDDSSATNKFVTESEKSTWNGKQAALTAGYGISISGNTISVSLESATGKSF